MTPTVLNTNIGEVEIKMPDNSKNNTTQEFKLANKNLAARLKQADLFWIPIEFKLNSRCTNCLFWATDIVNKSNKEKRIWNNIW